MEWQERVLKLPQVGVEGRWREFYMMKRASVGLFAIRDVLKGFRFSCVAIRFTMKSSMH